MPITALVYPGLRSPATVSVFETVFDGLFVPLCSSIPFSNITCLILQTSLKKVYAQDAWLPRLTPVRVRCSLPADAVVVRSRAAAAAALATLAQRAPLAL